MPRGPVDRECRACQGAHRAHTCRRRGNAQPSVVDVADKATKLPKTKAVFSEALQPERPAMKEVDRLKLVALQNELKGSHAIQTIAAAKELLDGDGECDRNALCAKHGITASPAAFERITAVVKQLGLLYLPQGAICMEDPTDANLLNDIQLLLQTANGVGGHSRSACALKTIAVAVEMLRVPRLNFTAACARHDIRDALGHSKQNIQERVVAVRDRIKELRLLERQWHSPIDRQLVAQVRAFVKGSSVAQAAASVGIHGDDVDAACEHVRRELGLPQPEPSTLFEPTRDLNDDTLLRELQRRLKVRSSAPALKTIAVAVDLCHNQDLDFVAACASYGISIASQKKAVFERVAAIRDRIKELRLLEALEQGTPDSTEEVRSHGKPAMSLVANDSCGKRPLPLDDEAWLKQLQERVGPLVSRFSGQKKEPPTLSCLAAAVEMCQISQLDLPALCIKHGIPVEAERSNLALFSHLRELRDRIKTLALLEVPPESLSLQAPSHSQELLISLQLRVQRSTTPPNLDNVAAALDLVRAGSVLDLVSACVRRRLELSQSRKDSVEALRVRIQQLEEPLDAHVDPAAVAEVRSLVKRSGVEKGASVAQAAAALVACPTDFSAACDHVRHQLGLPPAAESAVVLGEAENEADLSCCISGSKEERPPPPPLPDALLRELQRRIALHKKTHVLTGLHLIAAAADLCRDDQPSRWDQLDVAAVCSRHGISLGNQRKATLDKLKDLRDRMRGFGPLDQLVAPVTQPSTDDDVLLHDLQLLLQTSNGNGGASRPACAIKTIAVAVEMLRDDALDFDAACIKHQIPGVGSSARSGVYDRIATVRDRIKEMGLLERKWQSPIDRQLVAQVRSLVRGASVAQAAEAVGAHGADLEAICEHVKLAVKEREAEESAALAAATLANQSASPPQDVAVVPLSFSTGGLKSSNGIISSSLNTHVTCATNSTNLPDGWGAVGDDDEAGAWAAADAERLVAEMTGDGDDVEGWADPSFFGAGDDGFDCGAAPMVAIPAMIPNSEVNLCNAAAVLLHNGGKATMGLSKRARKAPERLAVEDEGPQLLKSSRHTNDGASTRCLPREYETSSAQNSRDFFKRPLLNALGPDDSSQMKVARLSVL